MRLIGFDLETTGTLDAYGLQPWRVRAGEARITAASVAIEVDEGLCERTAGKLEPTIEDLRRILHTAARARAWVVAWNAPFDASWLIASGLRAEVFATRWLDAGLFWRHLSVTPEFDIAGVKRKSYALKAAIDEFYPGQGDFKAFTSFHSMSPDDRVKLLIRNQGDARFTLKLARKFITEMPANMLRNALIEAQCIPQIAETLVEGIAVDLDAARTLDAKLEQAANLAYTTLKLDNPEITSEVLASSAQLSAMMFDKWGLPSMKKTAKGRASTDKDALSLLADIDPRAKRIHDYREATNLRTKFVTGPVESVAYNGDGMTRPAFRIFGTYTGRGTYSSKQGKGVNEVPTGIPLHQFKRGAAFRRLIKAPEGYDLLEFDFAGQEFRWMAVLSGDPVMLGLCQPGEDAHAYMGSRISRVDYHELVRDVRAEDPVAMNRRKAGKVANLALQYRTGYRTLQVRARTDYGMRFSDNESRAIWGTYQTTYLGVPRYWENQIIKGRRQGYVETLAGRRVNLGRADHWPEDYVWSYESTCINFPVQGIGADQKYLAFMVLRDLLPTYEGRVYYELHDGMFVIVPSRHSAAAAQAIRHALSRLPYRRAWGIELPISFPVDCKIGPSWGDLHEVRDA